MVDWKELLEDAAERVQRVTADFVQTGRGTGRVGRGAGGDATMLVDQRAEEACLEVFDGVKDLRLVTEEKGELGHVGSRWTAVIDPIDGSSNFARGLPFYCVSIAVAEGERLGEVRFGLVKNLVTGETYFAEAGGGATKNSARIRPSNQNVLLDCALAIDMCRIPLQEAVRVSRLVSSIKRQLHFGANALEVCLLAEGKVDGFVDIRGRMRITDFAAGYLIAKEAGASISSAAGGVLDPRLSLSERFTVVGAGNVSLRRKIVKKLGV